MKSQGFDEAPKGMGRRRTGMLKAYGNALCAPVATNFILAFMEAEGISAS